MCDAAAVVAAEGAVGFDNAMAGYVGEVVVRHDGTDCACCSGGAGRGRYLFVGACFAFWYFADYTTDALGKGDVFDIHITIVTDISVGNTGD